MHVLAIFLCAYSAFASYAFQNFDASFHLGNDTLSFGLVSKSGDFPADLKVGLFKTALFKDKLIIAAEDVQKRDNLLSGSLVVPSYVSTGKYRVKAYSKRWYGIKTFKATPKFVIEEVGIPKRVSKKVNIVTGSFVESTGSGLTFTFAWEYPRTLRKVTVVVYDAITRKEIKRESFKPSKTCEKTCTNSIDFTTSSSAYVEVFAKHRSVSRDRLVYRSARISPELAGEGKDICPSCFKEDCMGQCQRGDLEACSLCQKKGCTSCMPQGSAVVDQKDDSCAVCGTLGCDGACQNPDSALCSICNKYDCQSCSSIQSSATALPCAFCENTECFVKCSHGDERACQECSAKGCSKCLNAESSSTPALPCSFCEKTDCFVKCSHGDERACQECSAKGCSKCLYPAASVLSEDADVFADSGETSTALCSICESYSCDGACLKGDIKRCQFCQKMGCQECSKNDVKCAKCGELGCAEKCQNGDFAACKLCSNLGCAACSTTVSVCDCAVKGCQCDSESCSCGDKDCKCEHNVARNAQPQSCTCGPDGCSGACGGSNAVPCETCHKPGCTDCAYLTADGECEKCSNPACTGDCASRDQYSCAECEDRGCAKCSKSFASVCSGCNSPSCADCVEFTQDQNNLEQRFHRKKGSKKNAGSRGRGYTSRSSPRQKR